MTRKTLSNWMKTTATVAAFTTFTAASAHAGLTTVKPAKPSEMGIEQILEGTYGGNFSASGSNFTNGTLTATRIDDDFDQVWTGGTFDICAKAKFSGYTQSLGYMSHSDNTIHNLFDTTGFGLACSGSLSNIVIGDDFCFSRDGDSGLQMSELNENTDGRDHMVSFKIDGLNSPTYLLFFEDLNLTPGLSLNRSYADYNDLVVQVTRSNGGGIAAPLPPAVLTGGVLMAANAVVGLIRRKRSGK
jgi:hypothetical protein